MNTAAIGMLSFALSEEPKETRIVEHIKPKQFTYNNEPHIIMFFIDKYSDKIGDFFLVGEDINENVESYELYIQEKQINIIHLKDSNKFPHSNIGFIKLEITPKYFVTVALPFLFQMHEHPLQIRAKVKDPSKSISLVCSKIFINTKDRKELVEKYSNFTALEPCVYYINSTKINTIRSTITSILIEEIDRIDRIKLTICGIEYMYDKKTSLVSLYIDNMIDNYKHFNGIYISIFLNLRKAPEIYFKFFDNDGNILDIDPMLKLNGFRKVNYFSSMLMVE